jgi:hypothetical protein
MHFLSDNIVGYIIGAGSGILVPQLHRIKDGRGFTILPDVSKNNSGLAVIYQF